MKPARTETSVKRPRETYEPDEIRKLMRQCADSPTGHRDRLAILLLWCTGVRSVELHALGVDDVDPRKGVTAGDRLIRVPGSHRDELRELLTRWKRLRRKVARADSPLLCSLSGAALDSSYLRRVLTQLADAAGIGRRVYPQGFRNTFAAAMHRAHEPMEIIRRQLGHSDIEYTAGFVALLSFRDQAEAMEDFSLE